MDIEGDWGGHIKILGGIVLGSMLINCINSPNNCEPMRLDELLNNVWEDLRRLHTIYKFSRL